MQIKGRSLFGYFSDRNEAEAAKELLMRAGLGETQVDSTGSGRFVGGGAPAISGTFDSLSELTLGVETQGDDSGILLSADPSASGLASSEEMPQGKAWLVVTVTNGSDEEVERAVKIIKRCGGDV